MLKRNVLAVSLSLGVAAMVGQAAADVVGGGATLPENVFNDIISSVPYNFEVYAGVGSGTGKNAFFGNDATLFNTRRAQDGLLPYPVGTPVHYAGSDSIVTPAEFGTYNTAPVVGGLTAQQAYGDLVQLPFAATSVTVPFNNSSVSALELTGAQLAGIFNGQITDWADLGHPAGQITVIYRTDNSGTVEIFTRHLNAVAPSLFVTSNNFLAARQGTPASGASFVGASGSGGVQAVLAATPGSITFLSPDFVDPGNPAEVAAIENSNVVTSGNFFLPTEVNVQATISSVPVPSVPNALAWAPVFPNPADGYPIAGFTFLLASTCYEDDAEGAEFARFANAHYTGTVTGGNYVGHHDAYVSAGDLIPLPQDWAQAAHDLVVSNINDPTICAGRPGR